MTTAHPKMPDAVLVTLGISSLLLLACSALAGPSIGIFTDCDNYVAGETIEVSLSLSNRDAGVAVDVYVGLIAQSGQIYTVGSGGWGDTIRCWVRGIYLPSHFETGRISVFRVPVPSRMPPIGSIGRYYLVGYMTLSGTPEHVSDSAFASFTVAYEWRPDFYVDGNAGDDSNDGSEGAPFRTLNHALGLVKGFEDKPVTLHVAKGRYSASTNGEEFPLFMRSFVSIKGESRDRTILDGQDEAAHVIVCHDVHDLVIEQLTVRGGRADGPAEVDVFGGGILCSRSTPTIRNNRITNNWAAFFGGGIFVIDASPTIEKNKIEFNVSSNGAGIGCIDNSSPQIVDNTISGNWTDCGGGVCVHDSTPVIDGNRIEANHAFEDGGGIYCARSTPTIVNNVVSTNTSSNFYWWGDGGGIYLTEKSDGLIHNNLIVGNTANNDGGGICSWDESCPTISSNTIAGNTLSKPWSNDGGGICCDYDSSPTIVDCIIWGNDDDLNYYCTASYCCVGDEQEGEGNIQDAPGFVSGPYGDFYLAATSSCIDAGSRAAQEAELSGKTTQIDGTPDTGTLDIGYHAKLPTRDRPSVYIDFVGPNPAVQEEDRVLFCARASALDGEIVSNEWRSDLDGLLPDKMYFFLNASLLSIGTHRISMRARDDEGLWSELDETDLTILANFRPDVFVDPNMGNDDYSGDRNTPFRTLSHTLSVMNRTESSPVNVHLAPGKYAPSTNGEEFPLLMKSWVSLSGADASATVLDAESSSRHVIVCEAVEGLTIEGITIAGGSSEAPVSDFEEGTYRRGGGMVCIESQLTVARCAVRDNSAETYGGGIYCRGSSLAIRDSLLSHNVVEDYGGGIYCYESTLDLTNTLVVSNAAWRGAGIYSRYGSASATSCTIAFNTYTSNGPGIGIDYSGHPMDLKNCIIWGHRYDLDGYFTATYCCSGDDEPGRGNINEDPIFNLGPFGDCYLDPASPCIDAGSSSAAEAGLSDRTTQGDCSPDTGRVDIGFHYDIPTGAIPTARIELISPNPARRGGDEVHFIGEGADVDGTIEGYEWFSDVDGILGRERDFFVDAINLSLGTHRVRFRVIDDTGACSAPVYDTLTVGVYPSRHVFVNGTTGDDGNDGMEASPFRTIAHAIEVVKGTQGEPGYVRVGAGTYSPSTNGEVFPLIMSSWTSLLGEASASTILDAMGNAYHVLHCSEVTGSTIEGLTITGGNAYGPTEADRCGAGIYCYSSTVAIRGNAISGNRSQDYGGGIYCEYCSPEIQNNTIGGNTAGKYGGGIACCGRSSPEIVDNMIADNVVRGSGGGIYCDSRSSPVIQDNVIRGNSADEYGGGIRCPLGSSTEISGNTILYNVAQKAGGGIRSGSARITNNVIMHNDCNAYSGRGGGIDCSGSSSVIAGNRIAHNSASDTGGGIHCSDSSMIANNAIWGNTASEGGGICCRWLYEESTIISNNTITANEASNGGGIYSSAESFPTIIDCILWGNGEDLCNCFVSYCCVEDMVLGEGNIHENPMFVSGPLGEYYLDSSSPCVDAGSRSAEEAGLSDRTTQADGTLDTGTVDMGFHYPVP